jgi:hypothetical protein
MLQALYVVGIVTLRAITTMRSNRHWYQIKIKFHLFALAVLQLLSIALYLITSASILNAFAAQISVPIPSLMRAGASIVRLLVTYNKPNTSGTVYCTGLGVIVASWPARNASDQNNWVLTDSSLVNGKQA